MTTATRTQFTPGPWRIEAGPPNHMDLNDFQQAMQSHYRIYSDDGKDADPSRWVADVAVKQDCGEEVDDEGYPNIKLMVAAPELLAFAEECARADSDCGPAIREAARAAIAKATN